MNDVDQTAAALAGFVNKVQGRTVESNVSHERDGRVKARLIFDVTRTIIRGQ